MRRDRLAADVLDGLDLDVLGESEELEAEGVVTSKFQQTDANMMPASKALYEAVIGKKLTVPMTRDLRTHAALTIARHSRRGWRVDRAKREHPNDLIVALAMALTARGEAEQPVELVAWL